MFLFSKMQATGNDFIILNYLENKLEYSYKLLSNYLCNRHYGVGADGVVIIEKSDISDFKMRIFNKDGSEAEMCGNGIRCFAKYVYEKRLIDSMNFGIETLAGVKYISLKVEEKTVINVEVNMGNPIFEFSQIPVIYKYNSEKINIEGMELYPISIGNPHAICFVDDVKNFDVKGYGEFIENYKYFPNKTNVEFVQVINSDNLKVRVWERGVGETLACGTGACASAVIANLHNFTKNKVKVDLEGGSLDINYENNEILLKGGAEFVYEGKIDI